MNPILQRVLIAYRPLCQRGLLMDGQYRWPAVDVSNDSQESAPAARPRQCMLLAALSGLQHSIFHHWSKP